MITFSCSHCGMKFQLKEEFAGRTTRCTTCKKPLVVPSPLATQVFVPPAQIDGALSSLARNRIMGGVTLDHTNGMEDDSFSVHKVVEEKAGKEERYAVEGEIARGGMGAVLRAVDCDLRREVAVKYLLDQADERKKLRFVEEAQITGQLEHPHIVPIHELGVDADKRLFFSMKMVHGRSLGEVLAELRQNPSTAEAMYPLGRLLTIFVNVCHALAYAHSRNVIHRDLKPDNIMVGDFGEVYVMDWGLAKVLKRGETAPIASPAIKAAVEAPAVPLAKLPGEAGRTKSGSKSGSTADSSVVTNRESSGELTMEGTVMGTPVYMPPEQARGNLAAIDQRSDVYALGAILYEILTLHPPIAKEGDVITILARVHAGQITRPDLRDPARTRAGKVPVELAAIAMKALATAPDKRYQNVSDLRRDVELFQEGRSVSAKVDTPMELAVKYVKRNKGFSIATAVGLVVVGMVLIWSFWVNWQARRTAERNYARFQQEQQEKQERTRKAVPAFVKAARLGVDRREFDNAFTQTQTALDFDPDNADARLLRGQLLILRKDFAGARSEFEKYLKKHPKDGNVRALVELCDEKNPGSPSNLLVFAMVFNQQDTPALAEGLLTAFGENSREARKELLKAYRKRIDTAWPGLGTKMDLDAGGIYRLNLNGHKEVTTLAPLEGMPITWLGLHQCSAIRDLTPLKGMPLHTLELNGCNKVTDLTPLKGMPMTRLHLHGCQGVTDLAPLQGMPLTWLEMPNCDGVRDLTALRGMPLDHLNVTSCGALQDLAPLQGMPLTRLMMAQCPGVRDLSPLRGMPLHTLQMNNCVQVKDLTPLKGAKLAVLTLHGCPLVKQLTPLDGMELQSITLSLKNITHGIECLRNMKTLSSVGVDNATYMPVETFWEKLTAGELKK